MHVVRGAATGGDEGTYPPTLKTSRTHWYWSHLLLPQHLFVLVGPPSPTYIIIPAPLHVGLQSYAILAC